MDARARDESESMSSLSSSSLQRRVSHEARETSLVAKVQSLQHEAVTLRGMIAGGKADIGHIQSTLYKMLREHAHLATTVATVATSLEVVNDLSKGRAAKHIAISHTSLGSELHLLAKHLRALEEALQNNSSHLTTSPPLPSHSLSTSPPHSPHSPPLPPHTPAPSLGSHISSQNTNLALNPFLSAKSELPGPIFAADSGPLIHASGTKENAVGDDHLEAANDGMDDRGSLRLPDIYLTPSHLIHSDVSPVSSLMHRPSIADSPSHGSSSADTPSSLSQLDPFTPDTSCAPTQSEIPDGKEIATQEIKESERDACEEQAIYCADNSSIHRPLDCAVGNRPVKGFSDQSRLSVLEWLMGSRESCHSTLHCRAVGHADEGDVGEATARGKTGSSTNPSPDIEAVLSADDCDGEVQTTDLSENLAAVSPTARLSGVGSPSSPPPVSSPCGDSGISSSEFSRLLPSLPPHSSLPSTSHCSLPLTSHSSLPPTPHSSLPPSSHSHYYTDHQSPPPAISMSDIEALRSELARLRQEIMGTSRWSHTLPQDSGTAPAAPASTQSQAGARLSLACHTPCGTRVHGNTRPLTADTSSMHTPSVSSLYHTTRVSAPFHTPTPAVSRPYQSVSRPFYTASTSSRQSSSHRRLFPNTSGSIHRDRDDSIHRDRGDSMCRDQQSSVRRSYVSVVSQPRVVSHATQTTPPLVPSPDAYSSTKTQSLGNGIGTSTYPYSDIFSCSQYSASRSTAPSFSPPPSPVTTVTSSHSLPLHPSLPVGCSFTPRLVVHTVHHPSHTRDTGVGYTSNFSFPSRSVAAAVTSHH